MVIKPGETKSGILEKLMQQLRADHAHVLGIVLNEVHLCNRNYGYYYNRYYSKFTHFMTLARIKHQKPGNLQKVGDGCW